MDMSLMGLIKTMSPPAMAIFILLCLLSIYSLAVSVDQARATTDDWTVVSMRTEWSTIFPPEP